MAGRILWWDGRKPAAFDVGLAAGIAVADYLAVWTSGVDYSDHPILSDQVWALVNGAMAPALIVRRRFPAAVAFFYALLPLAGLGGYGSLLAYYTFGAYSSHRRLIWSVPLVNTAALATVNLWFDDGTSMIEVVLYAAVSSIVSILLGLYVGTRRELLAGLQERTDRLEREQQLLAERTRTEERTRIAREMHDVVANRVSVIVVHSGVLRQLARKDPERAAETAELIGDIGRQALDELRQVIGVLRLGDEPLPVRTPTLDNIRRLVDESRATGMSVDLQVAGEFGSLPHPVARTVFRIVQESLTNVHKHAGGAATRVRLNGSANTAEVSVENDPPAAGREDHALPSGGHGLNGLAERVTALGGTFEAVAREDGGFTVRAVIPGAATDNPDLARRLSPCAPGRARWRTRAATA